MKIQLEVSDRNEGTEAPWWIIVDPGQNFSTGEDGIYRIAGMITGPFFSREEAETVLRVQHYNFSQNATVFCASGYNTLQYHQEWRKADLAARHSGTTKQD